MITTAAILAAGVGSRLDPLTRDRPKCLVKVGGRPILQHQLDALRAAGIERVIIVVGYQEAAVRNWCRTYRGLSIDCVSNVDYEFTSNSSVSSPVTPNAATTRAFATKQGPPWSSPASPV